MKNGIEVVNARTVHAFDRALNEECFQHHECDRMRPFVRSRSAARARPTSGAIRNVFCPKALALGFSTLKKKLSLGASRRA